jgi:hypothetical protein
MAPNWSDLDLPLAGLDLGVTPSPARQRGDGHRYGEMAKHMSDIKEELKEAHKAS